MDTPKVIIHKQTTIANQYSYENEVGLSSYDLALISINQIKKKTKAYTNEFAKTTFLI